MTTVEQTQFFFNSSIAASRNEGNTRFSVQLTPPLRIRDDAKWARAFIHSASVMYSFPNIDSSNNQLVVDAGATSTTISLGTGVFSLSDMQRGINNAVNAYLHTQGEPLLTDANGTANFVTFTPNDQVNRVVATFNHEGTGIQFDDPASTLAHVLGFTSTVGYADPVVTVSAAAPLSFNIAVKTDSGASTQTISFNNGTFTATQIVAEMNATLNTLTSGEITSFLTSITVNPSEYVSGEYTAQFVLGQSTGLPSAVFAAGQDAAIQSVFGSTTSVRATRWSGTGPSHTAENAAAVDAVTEVGIACPGLTHGGYATDGAQANATIARWQVTGAPGYVLQYAPDNPLQANVDHLIGNDVSDLTLALVDQHGTQLTTLLGEHWSTILCIEVGY